MTDMISMVSGLLTLILILLLAYGCSRFLGKQVNHRGHTKYMRICDQMMVAQDRQLLIVGVGEEYFLLSNSQAGVTLVTKLDGDFPETEENTGDGSFMQIIKTKMDRSGT